MNPRQTIVVYDGTRIMLDGGRPFTNAWPAPAGFDFEPGTTLDQLMSGASLREGLLILPTSWRAGPAARALAEDRGWTCPPPLPDAPVGPAGFGAWTTFTRRSKGQTVHVGIADLMDPDRTTLFDPRDVTARPGPVRAQLVAYTAATGALWFATGGATGLKMLRGCYPDPRPGQQPRWNFALSDEVEDVVRGAGPLLWRREPTPEECEKYGYLHGFDLNGMYLAAAGVAQLAWGKLERVGQVNLYSAQGVSTYGTELLRRPGYWYVSTTDLPSWALAGHVLPPILARNTVDDLGCTWITTPLMVYLVKLLTAYRCRVPVVDGWLGRDRREILKPWARKLAAARASEHFRDCPPVEAAVKATYTEAIGSLGTPTGRVRRRDWAWTVRDQARANLLRKLWTVNEQTGRWPVAVEVDCAWYPSADEDPAVAAAALGLAMDRSALGRWKIKGTVAMDQFTTTQRPQGGIDLADQGVTPTGPGSPIWG